MVEYTILSSSSNAAFISNYAELTAEIYKDGALFDTISDLSDDGDTGEEDTGDNPTDVDLAPDPQLTVKKTVQEILRKDTGGEYTVVVSDDNLEVDDLVKYTILVENTGNLPLTNLVLKDSLYNLQNEFRSELSLAYDSAVNPSVADWVENEVGTLIPGEIETYTAEHAIVQIDIDSGGILNSVFATAIDPDDTEVNDVSDGDTESEDGDGDLDFENDPTKILISQLPLIEVTKTQRIREKDTEFISFGGTTGTSLSDWNNDGIGGDNANYNDGFISVRSISKPGEFFEFKTRALNNHDFIFGLVNTNDFSIDEIKEYFNASHALNTTEPFSKFFYFGSWYEDGGDRLGHNLTSVYLDPQGSSANFTKLEHNNYQFGSNIRMLSVSRVRVGFDENGKPTIWTYSKNPGLSNQAGSDTGEHPDPTFDYWKQVSLDESFDSTHEYHFMFKGWGTSENYLDHLEIHSEDRGILSDEIVYDITVENTGNVTLSDLALKDHLQEYTLNSSFILDEQSSADTNLDIDQTYYYTLLDGVKSIEATENKGVLAPGEKEIYKVRFTVDQAAIAVSYTHLTLPTKA